MKIETFTRENRISPDVVERLGYVSPGNWQVAYKNKIKTEDGYFVCDDVDLPEDARLIAAAPELLQAAIALLDRIDNITTEDFRLGGERQEREQLRAAIAKALGLSVESV